MTWRAIHARPSVKVEAAESVFAALAGTTAAAAKTEAWVLDRVVVREVKAEPSSDGEGEEGERQAGEEAGEEAREEADETVPDGSDGLGASSDEDEEEEEEEGEMEEAAEVNVAAAGARSTVEAMRAETVAAVAAGGARAAAAAVAAAGVGGGTGDGVDGEGGDEAMEGEHEGTLDCDAAVAAAATAAAQGGDASMHFRGQDRFEGVVTDLEVREWRREKVREVRLLKKRLLGGPSSVFGWPEVEAVAAPASNPSKGAAASPGLPSELQGTDSYGFLSSIDYRVTADTDASAAPARFAANNALRARLSDLFDTGMATPRGNLAQRLATELRALGRAVQVDRDVFHLLKLLFEELLSKFAFNYKMRRYSWAPSPRSSSAPGLTTGSRGLVGRAGGGGRWEGGGGKGRGRVGRRGARCRGWGATCRGWGAGSGGQDEALGGAGHGDAEALSNPGQMPTPRRRCAS